MTPANATIENVGVRLSHAARQWPDGLAIAAPRPGRYSDNLTRPYDQSTFAELDRDTNRIASGLLAGGFRPGMRIVLMVRPGIDFISLVFAMLKAGIVTVLIDPGMGRKSLIRCLQEVEPEGFIAIPLAHAVRSLLRFKFPKARHNVTVGRRWFWGGSTLERVRALGRDEFEVPSTDPTDPAAIIFTTGSTGAPKGVLYRQGNFSNQADQIRDFYDIQPGELDLPGFPLFALFNCTMGVGTVIPDMDPTRPAEVNPRNIIDPINRFQISQAFGSPALWNTVGRYCEDRGERMPTLRRVLSAGAPVPPHVLKRITGVIHPDGEMHTPYGATEALPVASTSAHEVLDETSARSAEGAGTCVGRRYSGIRWKVIRIDDGPLADSGQVEELPHGEIGELMVQGPVVTTEYVTRLDANPLHKVRDGDLFWHRMGDVGYLDDQDRFWFCGRKAHRVQAADATLFTIPCEAILNQHPRVYRSALVGIGPAGSQVPVLVAECWPEHRPASDQERTALESELLERVQAQPLTERVQHVLIHPGLPVDIRHNAKIFREQLAPWAAERIKLTGP